MADPREDKIDFQKLERELEAAVESDAHYWRENDAKMRAMEQRVETYEQFKDMVAAAHIKPLDKEDKQGMLSVRNQPWNPYCSKTNKGNHKSSTDDENKDLPVLPTNSNDFTKQWRKLKETMVKYKYLIDIGGDRLAKIFHAEISFGLLGDILSVLNQGLQPSQSKAVLQILTSLSETNRFSLSLDFLSKSEKTHCFELIDKLENCTGGNEEVDNTGNEGVQNETVNDGMREPGDELNGNSSNSKAETEEEKNQTKSSMKLQRVTTQGSDSKDIGRKEGRKETLEKIKNIYKVLPLGR